MQQDGKWVVRGITIAAFLLLCGTAYLADVLRTGAGPSESTILHEVVHAGVLPAGPGPPWYSVVPPLLAVTLAVVTNRTLLSLGAAVFVGGLLAPLGDSTGWGELLAGRTGLALVHSSATDVTNLLILLFVVLIMAMISVMLVAGGLKGVATWLARYAQSARSTRFVTVLAGLVIFIDDYANTMIVGSTLRPMTDQKRISREKLAFLVDATAAPVSGIAVISTWIGYEVGLLGEMAEGLGVDKGGYELFFDALGFRFYCLAMIAFVLLNALSGVDFGPMASAERRARDQGKLLADGEEPMTSRALTSSGPHAQAAVYAYVAIVPMLVVLSVFLGRMWFDAGGAYFLEADPGSVLRLSVWREVFSDVDSIPLLAYAAGMGLLVSMLLAVISARIPLAALGRAVMTGAKGSLLPVSVLILAWSLKGACEQLGTGEFLADVLAGQIPAVLFPALVFIVAGLTAFATGTSWGTMAILIPTAIPVAFTLDGDQCGLTTIISIAAVLDGAIFGDHCSPISDTTIMSSVASSCNHLAHVRTQMPYSVLVAGLVLTAGYLPAAAGVPHWAALSGAIGLMGLCFLTLRMMRSGSGD